MVKSVAKLLVARAVVRRFAAGASWDHVETLPHPTPVRARAQGELPPDGGGRPGGPDEGRGTAAAVLYLASPDGASVVGTDLVVDGAAAA